MLNGKKIRELRNAKDKCVAEMAFYVGISESMMRQVELGQKKPSVEGLKRIADFLGVTTDSLFIQESRAS